MNMILALVLAALFVGITTNIGEHHLRRPGWQPAIAVSIIGLIVFFVWDSFAR